MPHFALLFYSLKLFQIEREMAIFYYFILVIMELLPNINGVMPNEHGNQLYDTLMMDYNRLRRPADAQGQLGPITIRFKLPLSQIIDLVS
jgi:hypothetical protein